MKKSIIYLTLILAFLMTFSSCKKSDPKSDSSTSPSCSITTDSLYVKLSIDTITKNGFDFVKVTVLDKQGKNVTNLCNLLVNYNNFIDSFYYPTSTGDLRITATAKTCTFPSTQKILFCKPSEFTQKILLEDCTGAWCGFCPRGTHQIESYKATHPNCISIAVHGGVDADPMKFQYYSTFNSYFHVTGYPTILLNRKIQSGSSFEWSENNVDLDNALKAGAPIGLAISTTTNAGTITGTVKVKFGVTITKQAKIVVALVENGIVYPQTNYYSTSYGYTPYLYGAVSPVNDFVHNGVLRRTFTNLFGDIIPISSQTKDNIWELPISIPLSGVTSDGSSYDAISSNSAIIAFVVDATIGSTSKA